MSNGIYADFSRTCEGCDQLEAEAWTKDKTAYRCGAPGKCKGYLVGVKRFNPYIPAWCPKLTQEREQKLKGGHTDGQS